MSGTSLETIRRNERAASDLDVWLAAFENFLIARGLADAAGFADLKRGWTDAYLATPHGEPVELGRSERSMNEVASIEGGD